MPFCALSVAKGIVINMIEAINLCKRFGDKIIFDNLNFIIKDGEFVCFSGESGRGKTTLLNMIGMLEPTTSGKILINGHEIKTSHERLKYFRSGIGFVFQNFALVEEKSVEQNLKFIRKNYRTGVTIDEALCMVGLSEKKDSKVYTLSGGEQQRVALARLFIKQCDIILADEPTGSLDNQNAKNILQILKKLNETGKTVILVSHDEYIKKNSGRLIEL